VLAAWCPDRTRFAFRLTGRALELAWLYLPLVPLLGVALLADGLAIFAGFRPAESGSWTDVWWGVLLRQVQRSGPVFVKLGQWAATRPDLIPEEWCTALGRLHDSTEPHPLTFTHRVLSEAFPETRKDGPWYKRLLIEPEPVGSGCIAQVYIGHLILDDPTDCYSQGLSSSSPIAGCMDGLRSLCRPCLPRRAHSAVPVGKLSRSIKVAVKVVHPQVSRACDLDLSVLNLLASLSDALGLDHLGFSLMLRQFAAFLRAQTDLRQEAQNLRGFHERLGSGAAGDGPIVVPQVFDRWVAHNALVMSFEAGEPISELLTADSASLGREQLEAWRLIVDLFWSMVFQHRFVHGDMHPGNLFWRRRHGSHGSVQLVLLDCGLVIDLGGQAGEDLSMMVKAFFTRSEEEVAGLLIELSRRVGGRPEDVVDPQGFIDGIAALIRQGNAAKFTLSKLNAGALMGRSLLLGRSHRVRFDARFVNLMVAMVVVQGVAMRLHGEGDILGRMMPYVLGTAVSALRGKKASISSDTTAA